MSMWDRRMRDQRDGLLGFLSRFRADLNILAGRKDINALARCQEQKGSQHKMHHRRIIVWNFERRRKLSPRRSNSDLCDYAAGALHYDFVEKTLRPRPAPRQSMPIKAVNGSSPAVRGSSLFSSV